MRGVCLLSCILIAGCGGVNAPDLPEEEEQVPDAPGPPPVTLKVTLNWLDDSGQITATEDLTGLVVQGATALIPNAGAQGGFDARTAEITASGVAIRNVPTGTTYTLDVSAAFGRSLYVTDARDFDFRFYEMGRHRPAQPTTATPLTVDVSNMTAWQDGDTLLVHCARVAAFAGVTETQAGVAGWPEVGDTSLALTVDWSNVDTGFFHDRKTPLIDGNLGDRLVVTHGRQVGSSNDYRYDTLLETAAFSSFTQSDGAARTVAAAFSPTPHDAVHVRLRQAEFARYASDIHPDAKPQAGFAGGVTVRAQPADPLGRRQFGHSLAPVFTLFGAVGADIDMGQMVYPHPPSSWSQWLRASHDFTIERDTPFGVAQTVTAVLATVLRITPSSPATDVVTAVGPRISPPRSATLNGAVLAAPHSVQYQPAGAPIEIRWEQPLLVDAAPTSYTLRVYQLGLDGDEVTQTGIAEIAMPPKARALSIPWRVFPGTGAYYVVLTAISAEGEHDPKFTGPTVNDSAADTVSGILSLK
jgi:hypothetical protein